VLECGIDIVARPPGKQLQSISLLSGGEQTMTAVALLFSIYQVKPSPFCVLDELDAPLDESNINRFIRVLQRFLVHSQFIIITHNKRTIGMADVLYGVTMQEHGVSKIVSVKFHKAEAGRPGGFAPPSSRISNRPRRNAPASHPRHRPAGGGGIERAPRRRGNGPHLAEFREAVHKVQAINEQAWTSENHSVELTRAATTIENARMEWNAARLKFPLLTAAALRPTLPRPRPPFGLSAGIGLVAACANSAWR
jgi:hypothetical protein